MRIAALLLAVLLAATLLQPKYIPEGEALLHSDFEGAEGPGGLTPWRPGGEVVFPKAGGGSLGSAGARLTAGAGGRPSLEWDLSAPRRFTFIELRGMMRAEDVVAGKKSWETARMLLYFRDGTGKARWNYDHEAARLTGSADWREYARVFRVPAFAAKAHVMLINAGRSGVLWCDDISLRAVAVNPAFLRLRAILFGVMAVLFAVKAAAFVVRERRGALAVFAAAAILIGVLVSARWLGGAASLLGVPLTSMKTTGHFLLFAAFSYASYRSLGRRAAGPDGGSPAPRRAVLLLLGLLGFAAATELLQLTNLDRSASSVDWLIDAAGVLLGAALALVQGRRRPGGAAGGENIS